MVDTTLFTKNIDGDLFICHIYVNDIIFGSTNNALSHEFATMMSREFEMSMISELNFFLGFQIKQMDRGTFVFQDKYLKDMLKKFDMENCKPNKTLMTTNAHLNLDVKGKSVDRSLYRFMIGSLLYFTASRPDIIFSVCLCARFQANPKESHLSALRRIIRYHKHTPNIGFWYPKGANPTRWVLRFRLCQKSCEPQKHLRSLPLSQAFSSIMVKQEIKFDFLIHRGSEIYCCWFMLYSNSLLETISCGL
jgi:hypothetical protein